MKGFTVSLNYFSIEVFTVASSSSAVLVILGGERVASVWDNLVLLLISDFLHFSFAFLEAIELISLIFTLADIFTVLTGLEMFSSPDMPVRSSSLQGSLTCFGVTVRSSGLKLY